MDIVFKNITIDGYREHHSLNMQTSQRDSQPDFRRKRAELSDCRFTTETEYQQTAHGCNLERIRLWVRIAPKLT